VVLDVALLQLVTCVAWAEGWEEPHLTAAAVAMVAVPMEEAMAELLLTAVVAVATVVVATVVAATATQVVPLGHHLGGKRLHLTSTDSPCSRHFSLLSKVISTHFLHGVYVNVSEVQSICTGCSRRT